jgi:hypothetical protein
MPEEVETAPAPTEEPAPSAPDSTEEQPAEDRSGNSWFRETAQGLIYSRPLDTAKRSEEWAEANAELRRGRTAKQEDKPSDEAPEPDADTPPSPKGDSKASPREGDDAEFNRRVQAEVDRREAVRYQRAEVQFEEKLRRENPTEYARYKEQQADQARTANALTKTLRQMSEGFDEAAVKPLMDALSDEVRGEILKKAENVHGIPQRKLLVEEGLKALRKSVYDEGYKKGQEAAQKNLRRSKLFRDEIMSELRGAEDEPEHVNGNGTAAGGGDQDWDMNDWMRGQVFGRGRAGSRNGR